MRNTAVDRDDSARDVPGVGSCEEAHHCSHVLGLAQTLKRDEFLGLATQIVGQLGSHVGFDEAWRNDVGGNRTRTEFTRDRAGHTDDTGLGRRVVDLTGSTAQCDDGAQEDHSAPTATQHRTVRTLRDPESAGQIRIDDPLELIFRHPHQQRVVGDAGVCHEDLYRTLLLLDLLERGVDGLGIGNIADHTEQAFWDA